jgi:hypothetical protein
MNLFLNAISRTLSRPDGGFSIDLNGGFLVRTGYAVAVHPEHARVFDDRVSGAELRDFIVLARDALAIPGRVLGGWRDPGTGRVYLDVSVVLPDLGEALSVARRTRQLAVFQLGDRRSCRVR